MGSRRVHGGLFQYILLLGTIHKLRRQSRGEGVSQMPYVVNLPTEGGGGTEGGP